jgi:hypothetical protein
MPHYCILYFIELYLDMKVNNKGVHTNMYPEGLP